MVSSLLEKEVGKKSIMASKEISEVSRSMGKKVKIDIFRNPHSVPVPVPLPVPALS